jgi:hypothetical protein
MERTALVVGVTGIAGYNTRQALLAGGWRVVGLSRAPRYEIPRRRARVRRRPRPGGGRRRPGRPRRHAPVLHHLVAAGHRGGELPGERRDAGGHADGAAADLEAAARRPRDRVEALPRPFEAYAAAPAETPFRESQDRLPFQNFYYEQEDILFAAAAEQGFTWSVHRPHTMIGYALGNVMNMGVTLAVHGSICRATGARSCSPAARSSTTASPTSPTRAAGPARRLVGHRAAAPQPGVQHGQRRRLPLAPAVAPRGRGLRRGAARVPGHAAAAGGPDGHADERGPAW